MRKGAHISVRADACTACGVCVRSCPGEHITGARTPWRITIDFGGCTGCGECVTACPESALALEDGPTCVAVNIAACSTCGRPNAPEPLLARLAERIGRQGSRRLRVCISCRVAEEQAAFERATARRVSP